MRLGIAAAAVAALGQGAANGVAAIAMRQVDVALPAATGLRLLLGVAAGAGGVVDRRVARGVTEAAYAQQSGHRRGVKAAWPWLLLSSLLVRFWVLRRLTLACRAQGEQH